MKKMILLFMYFFVSDNEIAYTSIDFRNDIHVVKTIPEIINTDLNIDNVYEKIIELEIKEPLIVLAQSILETQWYECERCSLQLNNIFGMGWTGKTYTKYDHWIESVYDYKIWQELNYDNEQDYYIFLIDINYATDSSYTIKLKQIVRELKLKYDEP